MRHASLNLLRIVTGFLFFQHGAPKIFGWFGGLASGGTAEIFTLIWFSGILEVFGGLAIMVGLHTRPVAFILGGEMATAYFLSHFPLLLLDFTRPFMPTQNRGELAALYCFVFLFLAFNGGGSWSIDARRRKR